MELGKNCQGFAELLTRNDRQVIDGGIEKLCDLTVESSGIFSRVQSGVLRFNLMVMFVVLTLVGLYFFVF